MPADAYNFPLAWRWTQPTHNVLPADVMARIIPLDKAALPTELIYQRDGLPADAFEDIRVFSADVPVEQGTRWLRTLPVALPEPILILWADWRVGVQTDWGVFTQYWDDFCYAGSDDVEIFPRSAEWLLLYRHYEEFTWGRRRM